MKEFKKLLAVALAAALALSCGVTAFATTGFGEGFATTTDESTGEVTSADVTKASGATLTIDALIAVPVISVTVGTLSNMVLNPYKLTYSVVGQVLNDPTYTDATANDSVITKETLITNNSLVALSVQATPTATSVPNALTNSFVKTTTNSGENAWICLWLELATGTYTDGTFTPTGGTWRTSDPDTTTSDGLAFVVVTESDAETAVMKLDAAEKGESDTTPAYGAFKISGKCGGSDGWYDVGSDPITITVVFTFSPVTGS